MGKFHPQASHGGGKLPDKELRKDAYTGSLSIMHDSYRLSETRKRARVGSMSQSKVRTYRMRYIMPTSIVSSGCQYATSICGTTQVFACLHVAIGQSYLLHRCCLPSGLLGAFRPRVEVGLRPESSTDLSRACSMQDVCLRPSERKAGHEMYQGRE